MRRMRVEELLPFDQQIGQWRQVLERLAQRFGDGRAEVDPKPDACDNCGLWALCRIRERNNDGG
jgi:hypothetical protein